MIKILLVEDEKAVRLLTKVKLRDKYEIIEAVDGKDALDKLEETKVDLMIVDVCMPRMDGYELVRELRSIRDATPVIMLTAMGDFSHKKKGYDENSHENALRSRIWFTGTVNDGWTYTGMLQNVHNIGEGTVGEKTDFQRAYLDGRVGGVKVRAGRHDFQLGDANLYDTRMDGIKIAYGDKVKFGAYVGKPTNGADDLDYKDKGDRIKYGKFWGANLGYDSGKFALNAAYDKFQDAKYTLTDKDADNFDNNGVWSVQAGYNFGKATLGAIYLKSNVDAKYDGRDADTDGFVVTATYAGAEAAKPGTWGLTAKYYDQGAGTFIAHTMDGKAMDFVNQGFKGWSVAGNVTVAKNMIATVQYFDIKGKEDSDKKAKTLWSELAVTF